MARIDVRACARPAWRSLPFLLVPLLFVRVPLPTSAPKATEADASHDAPAESNTLPLQINGRVRAWMKRFRTYDRAEFQRLLRRRGVYEGLIRKQLRERGMPEELLYLAMMESGLKPRAESSASAVGIWQLMAPTAQEYGLRVDKWVDERRDPVRATDAALDYLSWLHDRYGSWYLAAAAYNAGPARVDRALALVPDSVHGEARYAQAMSHLPLETRQYVPRLVAASLLAQDADSAGFDDAGVHPYRYARVFVPGGTSLSSIARILGIDVDVMRSLNPFLIRGVTPPHETYPVRVPVGTAGKVVRALGHRVLRATD